MRIHDVTLALSHDLPHWPGDPPFHMGWVSRMEGGGGFNLSVVSMCVHCGTHVDAPLHCVPGGRAADELDLDTLNGDALVVELGAEGPVTADDLLRADIPERTSRVLLKTRNSLEWESLRSPVTRENRLGARPAFREDFVALAPDAAQFLVERGTRLVGVDYLSVASFDDGGETHKTLLGAGVVVVEGLDLSRVDPGFYILHCLPMKILGADGAPARVVLVGP